MPRTWPNDWERRYRGDGCAMCAQGGPEENEFGIRVYRSDTSDGYLQKADVGQRGYCLVIWRGRHVADVTQLSDTEAGRYWEDVLRVARAVEVQYTPAKLNLMTLGNELPHLHTHVVPRYIDDTEPGRPPRFMRADADKRQLPADDVRREAAKLRARLDGQLAE
ncbi:MAG: HIT family protein [Candidatus Limnocylindria bacterium]